jgi:hypothetical protein
MVCYPPYFSDIYLLMTTFFELPSQCVARIDCFCKMVTFLKFVAILNLVFVYCELPFFLFFERLS